MSRSLGRRKISGAGGDNSTVSLQSRRCDACQIQYYKPLSEYIAPLYAMFSFVNIRITDKTVSAHDAIPVLVQTGTAVAKTLLFGLICSCTLFFILGYHLHRCPLNTLAIFISPCRRQMKSPCSQQIAHHGGDLLPMAWMVHEALP